ncbi:MAG: type IV conjugative transfer system coupling protein TraD [Gammaproteobacteria bacterium]
MSSHQDKNIKNFTRGGQVTLHNIRMFLQIMDKVSWIAAGVFLIVTLSISFIQISDYERYVLGEYTWSNVTPILNPGAKTEFIQPNGIKNLVKYSDIQASPLMKEIIRQTCVKLIRALLIGLMTGLVVFIGISRWLKKRGAEQTENNLLKGDKILSSADAKKIIVNKDLNSTLTLAGLPLIRDSETAHIFFHGTTGSGKSNAIKELLDQIKKRGDRAIIYDKSCNYLEEFFDPRYDYLLNPLDDRGLPWDLWKECRDAADFDSLAAAQIPMPLSTQDPFWVNAARTIFSSAAHEMRNDEDRSITKLLKYLLSADLNVLQKYLKGTPAETLVSSKIEKTAISITSVLATYLKSLKFVKDGDNPFSIRQWIKDEKEKHWLFITSLGDRHETLKPLISSWIDVAVNALLSLAPDPKRRIWLILDELTSLQPLPYLTQTLSESRKFGGCIVIGVQNYAQLAKLYGQDGAREISSLLNTRFMFRQPDPEMAKWSANNFGESILDEVREGISYGANTLRDGISINRIEVKKALVSYSEIMSLANLTAFVRLPGNIPVTNVNFVYKSRPQRNIGLLERRLKQDPEKEITKWLQVSTQNSLPLPENKQDEEKTKEDAVELSMDM